MSMDFTVVELEKEEFGAETGMVDSGPGDTRFVGPTRDYEFDCPGVGVVSNEAVIRYESTGVFNALGGPHRVTLNNAPLPGGLQNDASPAGWAGHSVFVPERVLRPEGNILRVEHSGGTPSFRLRNILVFFKEATAVVDPGSVPPLGGEGGFES